MSFFDSEPKLFIPAITQDPPSSSPTGIKSFTERPPVVIENGKTIQSVPLIGTVRSGPWMVVYDEFSPGYAEKWVFVQYKVSPSAFALIVDGDSMSPKFFEGDIIVVDPELRPENRDHVITKIPKSDCVGDEGEATFKKLYLDGQNTYFAP